MELKILGTELKELIDRGFVELNGDNLRLTQAGKEIGFLLKATSGAPGLEDEIQTCPVCECLIRCGVETLEELTDARIELAQLKMKGGIPSGL